MLLAACAPNIRWDPAHVAWTARPARACPRLTSLGEFPTRADPVHAAACGPDRACLVLREEAYNHAATGLLYAEVSLAGPPRILRSVRLAHPARAGITWVRAATDGDGVVVAHEDSSSEDAWLAEYRTTTGALRWGTRITADDHEWRGLAITADSVITLGRGDRTTLRVHARDDGQLRHNVALGPDGEYIESGCLALLGDQAVAAWLHDPDDQFSHFHPRHSYSLGLSWVGYVNYTVAVAWVDLATGQVRREAQVGDVLQGTELACTRHGDAVVLVWLKRDGEMRWLRLDDAPALPQLVTRNLRNRKAPHEFHLLQLLSTADGLVATWSSDGYGHLGRHDIPRPQFITVLDDHGRATRVREYDPFSLLAPGPHGPLLYARVDPVRPVQAVTCAR